MQMSIIEVFICRRLHMNTSMILICIWLICRLYTALHTKCCGAVRVHHCQRLSLWYRCIVINHKSCMRPFCETCIVLVLLFSCTYTLYLFFLSFPSPNVNPVESCCPIIFISQFCLIFKSRPITSNGSPL